MIIMLKDEFNKRIKMRVFESAKVTLFNTENSSALKVESKDISSGGICLFVNKILEPNTLLTGKIKLPNFSQPFKVLLKVIWIKPSTKLNTYEVGCEFKHMSDYDRSMLQLYISHRCDT